MTELGAFLQSRMASSRPWNCSTMPADWCIERGHPDFAARWRDITDPLECEGIQRSAGLLALWEEGIGAALRVVERTAAGDIAVVECAGVQVGAIFTGERWAIQGNRSVHFLAPEQLTALKVWRP